MSGTALRALFHAHPDAGARWLRVSAGLDSLVVGEGQILSQMKACYANAIEGRRRQGH